MYYFLIGVDWRGRAVHTIAIPLYTIPFILLAGDLLLRHYLNCQGTLAANPVLHFAYNCASVLFHSLNFAGMEELGELDLGVLDRF